MSTTQQTHHNTCSITETRWSELQVTPLSVPHVTKCHSSPAPSHQPTVPLLPTISTCCQSPADLCFSGKISLTSQIHKHSLDGETRTLLTHYCIQIYCSVTKSNKLRFCKIPGTCQILLQSLSADKAQSKSRTNLLHRNERFCFRSQIKNTVTKENCRIRNHS